MVPAVGPAARNEQDARKAARRTIEDMVGVRIEVTISVSDRRRRKNIVVASRMAGIR